MKGFLVWLAIIVAAVVAFGQFNAPQTSAPRATEKVEIPVAPSCKEDWKLCKDNGDLADNFSGYLRVQALCKMEATDEAKYGTPAWPGFLSSHVVFSEYQPGTDYVTTGIVTAIERDAQFQNGFGAMVHSTVLCKYDLKTRSVISVEILSH